MARHSLVIPTGTTAAALTRLEAKWDTMKWDAVKWDTVKWDTVEAGYGSFGFGDYSLHA